MDDEARPEGRGGQDEGIEESYGAQENMTDCSTTYIQLFPALEITSFVIIVSKSSSKGYLGARLLGTVKL